MTTLPAGMHRSGAEPILRKLTAVQTRRWTFRVLTAAAVTGTVILGCLLASSVIAGYLGTSPGLLWTLRGVALAAGGFAGAWVLLRALAWRQNPAQTARFVEQRIPSLRNDLINAVLLTGDRQQPSEELVDGALHEAVRRTNAVDLDTSVAPDRLRKAGIALGLTATMLVAFALAQPGPFGRGLQAVVLGPDVSDSDAAAPRADIELLGVGPGNAVVFAGDRVEVSALVGGSEVQALANLRTASKADRQTRLDALVERLDPHVKLRSGERIPLGGARLRADGSLKLTGVLADHARQSLEYAVNVGGHRRPKRSGALFFLHVVRIDGIDLALDYPDYLGREDETLRDTDDAQRRLRLPVGTEVTVTVRASAPVPAAVLDLNGQPVRLRPTSRANVLRAGFSVRDDGTYRIEIHDADGNVRLEAPSDGSTYGITAVPDAPPRVAFQQPARDVPVAPGGALDTRIVVSDDYGLSEVRFHAARKGENPRPVRTFETDDTTSDRLDYTFALPDDAADGDTFVYYATATDNRRLPGIGGPQTARSDTFEIRVEDADRLAAEKSDRYEQLRRRLLAILQQQQEQRVNTALCLQDAAELAAVRSLGGQIVRGQERIKAALRELATEFPFDSELLAIRQAIADLVADEAQLAIDQARVVEGLDALNGRKASCAALAGTQEAMIDALERMLAIMPSLIGDKKPHRPGEDLPAEVAEKLAELKEKLEQFAEEQTKVVEASRNLAKTPADDFTKQQKELLDGLKAVQDKWEKFLNEQIADFSKLAEQDFSNPAMLKELMSVRSDVTMAKDALKKEAAEVATSFEDSGAENAESLTSNLEKWLPDEPDRAKWAMEAPPAGQENVEQPELPTELEDLVGDLLEQEEELFDEMDDLTSPYMASGDKGIGWDALDGPISSMNAQGVTGNQLPNTNEQGGRSGEGRSGKSSGEFVEDKAVGKGGRRTPTRLTEEPYQEGQVDDQSTDPPGGATGGGKLSGAGAAGLEGPVPPPLARQLERLAGKQASIINRAERIQAQFEVGDYAQFKFLEAITLMNRVRNDLEHHRYRNVLRSRDKTIDVLNQSRLMLTGQTDVTVDASQIMPKRIRKDIADAEAAEMPAGYRDALQHYYRRLSESGADE